MKNCILIGICMSLFSCGPMGDCKEEAEDLKGDECLLIVKKIPGIRDSKFDYKGINPITKEECDCNSARSDRWWSLYSDHIKIGDTIIKKKGELLFSIHKQDTVLNFNFECDGKIYK